MSEAVANHPAGIRLRARIEITGRVQGVGFRPFVARLAGDHGLGGWARNHSGGVSVEAEGDAASLKAFMRDLKIGTPISASTRCERRWIEPRGETEFRILASENGGGAGVFIPPDVAICGECLREMNKPANRRHGYPFINCAHCGPRLSIITELPYDRARTTMARFEMCSDCATEYESRDDRRFHAEPIACPKCGPALEWRHGDDSVSGEEALSRAVTALREEGIVAVKGIGGFHVLADAGSERAAARLRQIKRRDAKPLALMYPNIECLLRDARPDETERSVLLSPEAPIVLVEKIPGPALAPSVAPNHPLIGAMIAHSPLHHLLLREVEGPLIATSANFGEEPMVIDNDVAWRRFGANLDGVLMHDRDILRRVDDSVVRVIGGRPCPLRVGRGLAPVSVEIPAHLNFPDERCVLALGGHEKSSLALAHSGAIHLDRHLGDLDTPATRDAFLEAVEDLLRLHDCRPDLIVCDRHPDYFSTQAGEELHRKFGCELMRVQHHAAHLYSALLESEDFAGGASGPPSEMENSTAGICWDGTGLGTDRTIWGAEWLVPRLESREGFRRIASIRPFPLPGGEIIAQEPWRAALALASEAGVQLEGRSLNADRRGFVPDSSVIRGLGKLLSSGRITLRASSMGRLFDGVASMLGLRHRAQYSAQAAMELEFAATGEDPRRSYEWPLTKVGDRWEADWRPTIREIARDLKRGVDISLIAAAFHASLADLCREIARREGLSRVLLTGGCFQNKLLAESVIRVLNGDGVSVQTHTRVPPNDGGLSAGQACFGFLHSPTR